MMFVILLIIFVVVGRWLENVFEGRFFYYGCLEFFILIVDGLWIRLNIKYVLNECIILKEWNYGVFF